MKNLTIAATCAATLLSFASLPTLAAPTSLGAYTVLAQTPASELTTAGPLSLGMSQTEAAAILGPPAQDPEGVLSQASGAFTKQWNYPEQGVGLTLSAAERTGPYQVEAIILEAPCAYPVAPGISIGTLQTEAYNGFKTLLTEDVNIYDGDTNEKFGVIIMSSYTVLAVGCVDGVVKHIYLGPGPE